MTRKPRWSRLFVVALAITTSGSIALNQLTDTEEVEGSGNYTEVVMWEGGTLWQVAQMHTTDTRDIRDTLYEDISIMVGDEMVAYPDFNVEDLRAGQIIMVEVGE